MALRPRLQSEVPVYGSKVDGMTTELTSGVADAVAIAGDGKIDAVIDWKSDVDPGPALVELYRGQVRDYLAATKAPKGLIVYLTSSRVEKVAPNP
jgi:exodeoxyribonuclease-5